MSGNIKLGFISKVLCLLVLYIGICKYGVAGSNQRILGGVQAKDHELPFLIVGGVLGTLIRPGWGLTAGHCLNNNVMPFHMSAGKTTAEPDVPQPDAQTRNVTQYWHHPDYAQYGTQNDVALMKFDAPFELNEFVQLVPLVPQGYDENGVKSVSDECVWAASFGKHCPGTIGGDNGCKYEDESLEVWMVDIPIRENGLCEEVYGWQFNGTAMICAGYDEGGKDTCTGDSGGPLLVLKDGKYLQVGITSWGANPCGQPKMFAVYTRLSTFVDWIDETIRNRKYEEENGKS